MTFTFTFKTIVFFIFFWGGGVCWVFVDEHRLSLVVASGGYSLVSVRGLLITVASLVVEHRLKAHRL